MESIFLLNCSIVTYSEKSLNKNMNEIINKIKADMVKENFVLYDIYSQMVNFTEKSAILNLINFESYYR
ncbi:MAG: hypothetical protein CMG59_06395 [Candidatus Marinimicrobia bacterium]|nr:hypothetical protein [Candidatus Neomarinimicrobiota bacterium]